MTRAIYVSEDVALDRAGDEVKIHTVYVGDEDAEPLGRVYTVWRGAEAALELGRRMSRDRRLELVTS